MIVLALDTCLGACSAALIDGERLLGEGSEPMHRGHQERIAPMAREVMARAGAAFRDIDRIGVTVGPGSFTGLRVGLAFAKGLALALGRPCVGVGTLEALAASVSRGAGFQPAPAAAAAGPQTNKNGREARATTTAVIDAGRGRVYLQTFAAGEAVAAPDALTLEAAEARLRGISLTGEMILTGPGAPLLAGAFPGARIVCLAAPAPEVVARLAAGGALTPPRPLYLRAPDAKPRSP